MKILLTTIFLGLFSFQALACVNLTGTYADYVVTIELKQTGCENLTQSTSDWYVKFGLKADFILNAKEYSDPNFKNVKGSYAFIKAEIDEEKMQLTFRRGNPSGKENTFIKTYSKDSNGSLVIKSYDVNSGSRILKSTWILAKK